MDYDSDYFSRYNMKNMLGRPIGERRYFYDFWERYLVRHLPSESTVLEVGCGPGYMLQRLTKHFNIYAMDISHAALLQAGKRAQHTTMFQADAQNIPLKNGSIDCIVAFDLIEHLDNPEEFLKSTHLLLKPGGLMILATPNPQSLGCLIKEDRIKNDQRPWESRLSQWHGWRDETHINIQSIDSWRTMLKRNSFQIIRDGSDFWWVTPYFSRIPVILQKIVFNGSNRILTYLFGFLPWKRGENYYAVVTNT